MSCRINGALTKDKSAAMDIIRVDHSRVGNWAIKKSLILNKYYCDKQVEYRRPLRLKSIRLCQLYDHHVVPQLKISHVLPGEIWK